MINLRSFPIQFISNVITFSNEFQKRQQTNDLKVENVSETPTDISSTTQSAPAAEKLWSKSFIALMATQFFTAFNDNMFRWFVVKVGQDLWPGDSKSSVLALGAACFTLPYLLFAPMAGSLADRFSKRSVIVACKVAEIAIVLLGTLAVLTSQLWLLFLLVFCMGAQSALFSPAKIGVIPEILPFSKLSKGNGLFAMVTVIACAAGTIAGYAIYGATHSEQQLVSIVPAAIALLSVAVVGLGVCLPIQKMPAGDPSRSIAWNPISNLQQDFLPLFRNTALFQSALGIAFFYFLALLIQLNIDLYGANVLRLTESQIGPLMGALVAGLGIGGVLAGICSGQGIRLGMVPFGAIGITVCLFLISMLGFWLQAIPETQAVPLTSSYLALLLLGVSTGFFYIPLEAFLQHYSELSVRGSILAASNALTNAFMLCAAGALWLLTDAVESASPGMGLTAPGVFSAAGVMTIPVITIAFALCAKQIVSFVNFLFTSMLFRLNVQGAENVPQTGGALITPNHISWMDGLLMSSAESRDTRYMIYAAIADHPWLRWLTKISRTIPIARDMGPKAMIQALKNARKAVEKGDVLCVFPEGGISRLGRSAPFQKGIMKIVEKTTVPIIPVSIYGLWGSYFSFRYAKPRYWTGMRWPFRVTITYGKPITEKVTPAQLKAKVDEMVADSFSNEMRRIPIPVQRFVRECKRSRGRMKVSDSSGAELTGGKLLAGAIAFRRVLERSHLEKQDEHIGVLLPPSAGGALANAVIAMMGRVSVNLNYTLTDEVMNFCVKKAGIRKVLTSRKFLEKRPTNIDAEFIFLEDVKEQVSSADRAIAGLQAFVLPASVIDWIHGLNRIDRDSPMTVIFTSGSTGEPKGVVLSHNNVGANIESVDQLFKLDDNDTTIGILPFFHAFGYTIGLWTPFCTPLAGTYHFNPLDSREVGRLAEKYKATIIMATPTFLRTYVKRVTPEQFAHMRLIVVGAEKLTADLSAACEEKFGVAPIEGYGSTEMSPLVAANQPDFTDDRALQVGRKLGTVGCPVPGVVAKIVNPETMEDLGLETEGLLLVRGPNRMLGYLDNPEKTAEVFVDEWYNTGDIGKIDSDGFISLTGRQSRFSKIGGEMVPHLNIEESLSGIIESLDPRETETADQQTASLRVAVTAVPDVKKGERLIILHTQFEKCTIEQVLDELGNQGLPNLWLPDRKSFVEVEEIPLLGTGKLDLKGIKDVAMERCG